MSETWVFVITDPDKMATFAAKALHEGWMRSCYRMSNEDRITAQRRPPSNPPIRNHRELYDQDA